MRPITEAEKSLRDRRTAELPGLIDEIIPAVGELAAYVGYDHPDHAADEPGRLLPVLEDFLKWADLAPLTRDQRIWLHTRLMYFTIELLTQRYGGYLFLQVDPGSDFFLRYVVGDFKPGIPATALVEPFELIAQVLRQPPGRSLANAFTVLETSQHDAS